MKKIVITFGCLYLITGCYQWHGELNTRITKTVLALDKNTIAIGLVKFYARYPLFDVSGWSRGVPKISGARGEIYFYNIKKRKIEKRLSIKPPSQWDDITRFKITPYIWNEQGLYFTLSGCPKTNQSCSESQHYLLLSNGKTRKVETLPQISKADSDRLGKATTYQTYSQDHTDVIINIGPRGGPWEPVLIYRDHKFFSVDGMELK